MRSATYVLTGMQYQVQWSVEDKRGLVTVVARTGTEAIAKAFGHDGYALLVAILHAKGRAHHPKF